MAKHTVAAALGQSGLLTFLYRGGGKEGVRRTEEYFEDLRIVSSEGDLCVYNYR